MYFVDLDKDLFQYRCFILYFSLDCGCLKYCSAKFTTHNFFLGTEEDVVKSKKTFRSQAVVNQNAETELMLEGDDDAVSLLQEKEIDNLAGNYDFSLQLR